MVRSVQVCLAAVGLVCDLCRALQSNILPYCDEIMQLLLENLGVRNAGTFPALCFPVWDDKSCTTLTVMYNNHVNLRPFPVEARSRSPAGSVCLTASVSVPRTRTSTAP